MAKFRAVQTAFWEDPKVIEEMTPEDKYFFLYILTNPNTKQIGIYETTRKQMAFDMGYSMEAIQALIDRFTSKHGIVKYNPETREIAIKNWGKYNFNRGGKPVIDCVKSELEEVKDKELIKYVAQSVERPEIRALYDTYYESCDDTLATRGQKDKEKEKEKEEEKEQYKEKEKEKEKEENQLSKSVDNVDNLKAIADKWKEVRKLILFNHESIGEKLLSVYPLEDICRGIERIKESDYLMENCTFDWFAENFIKIHNGHYDNYKRKKNKAPTSFHNFEQASDKYTNEELEAAWFDKESK